MPRIVVEFPDHMPVPEAIGLIQAAVPQAIAFAVISDWIPEPPAPPAAADEAPAPLPAVDEKLEEQAREVVELIRPSADQWQRKDFLRAIWLGLDSHAMSGGDEVASPRGVSTGLSRTLRRLFLNDGSPLDRLFPRTRVYDKAGIYMGVRYTMTPLGVRVINLLVAEGSLGEPPDPSILRE